MLEEDRGLLGQNTSFRLSADDPPRSISLPYTLCVIIPLECSYVVTVSYSGDRKLHGAVVQQLPFLFDDQVVVLIHYKNIT